MSSIDEENKGYLQKAKKLSVKKDNEIILKEEDFLKFEEKIEFDITQKKKEEVKENIDFNEKKIQKNEDINIPEKNTIDIKQIQKSEIVSKNTKEKDIDLKDIKNILDPDIKSSLESISSSIISKKSIDKLLKDIEASKDIIFDKKIINTFPSLKQNEVDIINKKMEEWNIPKEAQELNAEVIIAWLKNSKKNV